MEESIQDNEINEKVSTCDGNRKAEMDRILKYSYKNRGREVVWFSARILGYAH